MRYFTKMWLIGVLIFCLITIVFSSTPILGGNPPAGKPSQICDPDTSRIPIMSAPKTWCDFRTGVAMIRVSLDGWVEIGTGFLYDDCCLVTARHVIAGAINHPERVKIWFGYEDITPPYTSGGDCNPDVWDCCDLKLNPYGYDVGVVYIKKKNGKCPGQSGYGLLPISGVGPQQGWGAHVIGHPQARCKEYSHDSYATIKSNGTVPTCGTGEWSHGADTEAGSSGSPVFDDAGKVIGIHVGADTIEKIPCKNCFVPTASVYNWLIEQKPCGCIIPGTLQFSSSSYSVTENAGTATITVIRTGGSDGAVGVSYATSNGTAIAPDDYTATSGVVTFADGDMTPKIFNITIINDAQVEGNETVNLALSNPTGGATLGNPNTAVLTINDDDSQPSIPTLSEWGRIGLVIALLATTTWVFFKKRKVVGVRS